ncbi:MAG TPA: PQQ-dependent sugar dehydrogenase [Kofleriaceae bacterium]
MSHVRTFLACLAIAGCGGGSSLPPGRDDDAPPITQVAPCTPTAGSSVTFRKLALTVDGAAMLVTSPPGDPRLFVVENRGAIRIIDPGEQLRPLAFLDLSPDNRGPVVAGGELGLLGLAFHPQYAQNGQFFVFYTATNTTGSAEPYMDVLSRFTVSSDPAVASPTTETVLLAIPDPYANHNGGMIEFGADGYLYIGTGDGGSAGDPERRAQNPNQLLGKFLRLDVDHADGALAYAIPDGNPYKTTGGGRGEIFMLGVRNPWRWSFDKATGDLWLGDVGQGAVEEIDVLEAGHLAGANLGWSMYEGPDCCATVDGHCQQTSPYQACVPAGKTYALDNRRHSDGWAAIIGGQVYRGACYPDLTGWYFYTDDVKAQLVKAQLKPDRTLDIVDLDYTFPQGPASIHADSRGELYATDIAGGIYQLEAHP